MVIGSLVVAGLYAFVGEAGRPLVGASAALAAVVAALLLRHGTGSLRTYVAAGGDREISFELPALAALGVWFVGEVVLTVTSTGVGPTRGTGITTLCGGILGVGASLLFRRLDLEAEAPGRSERRTHPALASAQAARDAGRPHAALSALEPAVRTSPHDSELVRALCDAACEANEAARAVEPLRKLIVEQVRRGEASAAAAFWRAFGPRVPGVRLDPRTAIELAVALAAATEKALAARVLRDTLASSPRLGPGVAMRMCEVAAPLHRETAIKAGRMALAAEGLDEAKRAKLEARIAALEAQAPSGASRIWRPSRRRRRRARPPPARPRARWTARSTSSSIPTTRRSGPASCRRRRRWSRASSSPPTARRWRAKPAAISSLRRCPTPSRSSASRRRKPMRAAPPVADAREELAVAVAADQSRFHELKCVEAVPTALDVDGLALKNGPHVDLARVDAIAVGGVHGMAAKPVLLIDLLLNFSEIGEAPLRAIRLRSDHFDPRALFPNAKNGMEAFRALVDELLARTGATPLPDSQSCSGKPFKMFPQLAQYEREVLQVER